MAVKIRLKREGRRNRPFYRVVACDARLPRDGKVLEVLGHYDPLARDDAQRVVVKEDRVRYWFERGAIPTETVVTLLRRLKIYLTRPRKKKKRRPRGARAGSAETARP